MAFARPMMDYSIDKDYFWQLSSPSAAGGGLAGAGGAPLPSSSKQHQHQQQRFPSDFFDNFVVMEDEGSAGAADFIIRRPSSTGEEGFFVSHQDGDDDDNGIQQQQGGGGGLIGEDGISPGDMNANINTTMSMSSADSMALSYTTSSFDGPVQLASLAAAAAHNKQQQQQHQRRPGTTITQTQSQPQGQAAGRHNNDATAHHGLLGHLNPETLEQRQQLLSGRRGQDVGPQPVSGSISDSELLQLEGLSVNPPRRIMAAGGGHQGHAVSSSLTSPTISSTSMQQTFDGHAAANENIAGLVADEIDLAAIAKNQQQHHRSGARRLETIYSTIRRAVGGHPRERAQQQQQQHQQQQPQHQQHPNTAPIPQTIMSSHMESARKETRRLASEGQAIATGWNGLPLSPPLTDMAAQHGRPDDHGATIPFGAGYLDDPFFDPSVSFQHTGGVAPAAQIHGGGGELAPHTPSRTPVIKSEGPGSGDGGDLSHHFFPLNAAGPWGASLDGSFASSADDMSGGNIMSFDGANMTPAWAFATQHDSGSGGNFNNNINMDLGGSGGLPDGAAPSRNHHNLTIQVPPSYAPQDHHRHSGGPEDLATGGLMIHMPQPQTPNTGPLLSSQVYDDGCGPPGYPFPDQQQQQHPHSVHTFGGSFTDQQQCGLGGVGVGGPQLSNNNHNNPPNSSTRRPKPRAPSSGARYHHHMGATTISPRKTRPPSLTSSSPSPTPGVPFQQQQQHRRRSRSATGRAASLHRMSTGDIGAAAVAGAAMTTTDAQSHAIRKRRSASSWLGGGRRTGSSVCASSVPAAAVVGGGGGDMMLASLGGEGGSIGASSGQIGFVNYTPNDHNVLMTGVAPSGSSKTKARREKEAMEKQRRLSEAVRKAVTAAGVDVGRLKEEGIVI